MDTCLDDKIAKQLTASKKDAVLIQFPDVVKQFAEKGYSVTPAGPGLLSRWRDGDSRARLYKRIWADDIKDGVSKRAYSIYVEVFNYRDLVAKDPGMVFDFGLKYVAFIDSGGPDQMEVSFGQNGNYVDIAEAEDRFLRVFNGLGQPFYRG